MTKQVAVIGGDARYLELIQQLQTTTDISLHLVGFDKIEHGFKGFNHVEFNELNQSNFDAIILPITGTDQDGYVETVFSDQTIKLTYDWFLNLKQETIVFTGISNDYLNAAARYANISLIPLLNRDDVAIYNSIPTAEGTIMMAIEHTDYTIHSSRVIVVGFGRVGNTISNKFRALGADVSVCADSIMDLARITELGHTAIPLDELHKHTSDCDLLINTIPSQVITKEEIQHFPPHSIIFDIASKPGGTDFDYAKRRGIKAILAKSLPGVVAPKTAGKILANVVSQLIADYQWKEHE